MGIINTGAWAKALWPGLNSIFGLNYNEWPEEYTMLFSTEKSDKAYEEDLSTMNFGLAAEKSEGSGIMMDEATQGFVNRYINKTYTLGYAITQETIEDNQYNIPVIGANQAKALAFSMRQTKEILGANIYNRAFTGTGNPTYADGQVLIYNAHVTKSGGTYSNTLAVASDLSEAALEQMCIDIAGTLDDRGNKISVMPTTLIIPKELMFEAERILKSTGQNDTANNAINALKSTGMFKGGVKVNHYLTDPDAFFVRTNVSDGMKYFNRQETEFASDNDFNTTNVLFRARFRCSFGASDPRGIFGSPGA